MFSIVRGTTPTIRWIFSEVNVEDIVIAYLTIRRRKDIELEKDINDATIDNEENSISWTLTQEETLELKDFKEYSIHCDWVLGDSTRGAGTTAFAQALPAGKDEVI